MEGTLLSSAFASSIGVPIDYDSLFSPLYGVRTTPHILRSDLSGSTFSDIEKEVLFSKITETTSVLPLETIQMTGILSSYNILKTDNKYTQDAIKTVETRIETLENAMQQTQKEATQFMLEIGGSRILSSEDFLELEKATFELREKQNKYSAIILRSFKDEIVKLKIKHRELLENFALYQEFIKTGVLEMVGENAKPYSCSICYENEVTDCFVPCGHTFCNSCIVGSFSRNTVNTCMSCRQTVEKRVKLYLGV